MQYTQVRCVSIYGAVATVPNEPVKFIVRLHETLALMNGIAS